MATIFSILINPVTVSVLVLCALSREKIEIQFVDKRDKICYADSSNERNEVRA